MSRKLLRILDVTAFHLPRFVFPQSQNQPTAPKRFELTVDTIMRIYFTRQNNLYVMCLEGSSLEQLTDTRTSSPASGRLNRLAKPLRRRERRGDAEKEFAKEK